MICNWSLSLIDILHYSLPSISHVCVLKRELRERNNGRMSFEFWLNWRTTSRKWQIDEAKLHGWFVRCQNTANFGIHKLFAHQILLFNQTVFLSPKHICKCKLTNSIYIIHYRWIWIGARRFSFLLFCDWWIFQMIYFICGMLELDIHFPVTAKRMHEWMNEWMTEWMLAARTRMHPVCIARCIL